MTLPASFLDSMNVLTSTGFPVPILSDSTGSPSASTILPLASSTDAHAMVPSLGDPAPFSASIALSEAAMSDLTPATAAYSNLTPATAASTEATSDLA